MTSSDDIEWVLNNPELGDLISDANTVICDNNHRGERELEERVRTHPLGYYNTVTSPDEFGEYHSELVWVEGIEPVSPFLRRALKWFYRKYEGS